MSEPDPRMTSRSALAKGLVLVGAATLIGNGAAYLLSMVSARILNKADFGALGALLGLLVILATLGISTQALAARRVATATTDREQVEEQLIRLSIFLGFAVIVGGIAVAWPIGMIFTIPALAVATGIGSLGFVIVGSAAMGIAQGREEHTRLSLAFIANGGSRAVGGIIGVVLLASVTGVGIGVFIGCAVGAVIAYLLVRRPEWKPFGAKVGAGIGVELGHVVHALMVLFTLTNVDILLARFFLTEDQSGQYAVGVLLAKIAFFLPNAIVIVLFPKMSAEESRRTVYIATGLTAIVGTFITASAFLLGDLVARILGGQQYVSMGDVIWLFALEGSAFALVQVLLYARLAAQDRRAVVAVWIALITLVVVVATWRNDSVTDIVTTVVVVSLALTVVGLFLDRRNGTTFTVPIESAE
ncbi:MAG: oligosaccharide flippase family protein [Actinomycetota bacterium]|nr:oligosaccharide flippase family protein [Actinomycetota bacterium]